MKENFSHLGSPKVSEEEDFSHLGRPQYGNAIADPSLLNQLGSGNPSRSEKINYFKSLTGAGTTPAGNIQDFLYGVGKSGAGIARSVLGERAPQMPDIRQAQPNMMAQGLGQFTPFAAAAGPSLLGAAGAGGAYGLTQHEPGQTGFIDTQLAKLGVPTGGGRLRNAAEDALINSVLHGLLPGGAASKEAVPNINFQNKSTFSPAESEFTRTPMGAPNFSQQGFQTPLTANIAKELHQGITGEKGFEEAGKDLASHINETYQRIKGQHIARYEDILKQPTQHTSYATGEPIPVRNTPINNSKYVEDFRHLESKDKNIQSLHDEFIKNPTIDNAHKLQSEYGLEIGYLKKQKENKILDETGRNKLKELVEAQKTLHSDLREGLHSISPELKGRYETLTEDWKRNVIPYTSDRDLRAIAEGRIKNPTQGQVTSIFRNPEESINKVASDLNQEAKDKIVHLGMGRGKYENTPEQMMNARNSLESQGLESYINPYHEQNFRALRNNMEMEKAAEEKAKAFQEFEKQFQVEQDRAEKARVAMAKAREQKHGAAIKESEKLGQAEQKKLNKNYADFVKANQAKIDARYGILKKVLLGGTGIGAAHALGVNPVEELLAYYALQKNAKKR